MKKVLLTVTLLFTTIFVSAQVQSYTPPTRTQIKTYLESITLDQLISEELKLDALEHVTPVITPAKKEFIVLKDGSLVIEYLSPLIIDINNHDLHYEVTTKTETIPGVVPKTDLGFNTLEVWGIGVGVGVSTFAIGYLIGHLTK